MKEPNKELDNIANEVIGAAIEVHRVLGPGLLECVYEQALSIELDLRRIAHVRQLPIEVKYKLRPVGEGRLDFLIGNCLVLELKAVDVLAPIHTAKMISYLKIAGYRLGLLMNFNVPVLKMGIKRIICS